MTHIGPIRKYFENDNFCRHCTVTSVEKLAKFEILPICLKLVGNLDFDYLHRPMYFHAVLEYRKPHRSLYSFHEFLAISCHSRNTSIDARESMFS